MASLNVDVPYEVTEECYDTIESALTLRCYIKIDIEEYYGRKPRIKATSLSLCLRNPTIAIKNVPNDARDEQISNIIKEQNPEIVDSDENCNQTKFHFTLKKFS
ncbi:hypothetical protein CEXT_626251 [Caerostris extrusa]|uniref:Uncharacterized protein n=1 Tax=Caerostris extrusa TaxID=172846 RepID=A0AAV4U7Q2_CAEEX|nr:hypothetical protein CEXT_626251 [Caerostris extrusa]